MSNQIKSNLRYDTKAMILINNNLPLNSENFKALDILWDDKGNYQAELVSKIIKEIKSEI